MGISLTGKPIRFRWAYQRSYTKSSPVTGMSECLRATFECNG